MLVSVVAAAAKAVPGAGAPAEAVSAGPGVPVEPHPVTTPINIAAPATAAQARRFESTAVPIFGPCFHRACVDVPRRPWNTLKAAGYFPVTPGQTPGTRSNPGKDTQSADGQSRIVGEAARRLTVIRFKQYEGDGEGSRGG
ncbi:hypothetical protein GCM10007170_46010 [Arthrobacter liuii]|uniref:PASTA domain-containing protein n=1 Tax=Arthrobacter liuii TaxID=1476996 RepID=A0ABQ2B280_9MICC|nr:hypothetical protein GCM10007170_46010 [Arthrobacter liuii]